MITSKDNEKIKFLKTLKRDKNYLFLDSPKLIDEAFNAGFKIEFLIVNKEKYNSVKNYNCEVVEVCNKIFENFTSTESSQGVVAIVKNKKNELKTPTGNFLVLDGLQDPGNVGTLMRSAVGAGFTSVYLLESVNTLNEKLVRSSMGAIFKLEIFECTREEFTSFAKENLKEIKIYSCDLTGENIFNAKVSGKFGLILGNEGNGITNEIKKLASKTISIPMKNNLESLNVAVAGSLIMFELTKSV